MICETIETEQDSVKCQEESFDTQQCALNVDLPHEAQHVQNIVGYRHKHLLCQSHRNMVLEGNRRHTSIVRGLSRRRPTRHGSSKKSSV